MSMATTARRPWAAILRLLERDERVFAVLLAVVMVGGLATLGLAPLRARNRIDIFALVLWFAAYKLGIFALVIVSPRQTRGIFIGALATDLMLVFALLYLTGGGDSPFVNLFFPLVAVNAYYFGRWIGLFLTLVAGLLYWAAAELVPPGATWSAVAILMGLVGLPAFALGHVAERERRAREEVEHLYSELSGTLSRLQSAQEKLVEAERMATVGRLSLKVAHEVRNPIAAIELNAELLGDIVRERHGGAETDEAGSLVGRHPRPGLRPRRAHRGIPGLRPISPRPVRGRFGQRHGQLGGRVREAPGRAPGDRRLAQHRPEHPADGDRPDAASPGRCST